MKRRDMEIRNLERSAVFYREVQEVCAIHDLQGMCRRSNGEYTIGVEAIDMEDDPLNSYVRLIPEEEIYIKACFSECLHAVFTLLLHKRTPAGDFIHIKQFVPDHTQRRPRIIYDKRLSEEYFLKWWRARKDGAQRKAYRPEMEEEIRRSYFDQLLESNGSSWSGNIDGFVVRRDAQGDVRIAALVENRFSNKKSLTDYDPKDYFRPSADSNGGDRRTWQGLKEMADIIGVPLLLCTYSAVLGNERKVGLACVESVTPEELRYLGGVGPAKNICCSAREALQQMNEIIGSIM